MGVRERARDPELATAIRYVLPEETTILICIQNSKEFFNGA